jgi:hypothetical protein
MMLPVGPSSPKPYAQETRGAQGPVGLDSPSCRRAGPVLTVRSTLVIHGATAHAGYLPTLLHDSTLTPHCVRVAAVQVPAGLRDMSQEFTALPATPPSLALGMPFARGGAGTSFADMRATQLRALQHQIELLAATSAATGSATNLNYEALHNQLLSLVPESYPITASASQQASVTPTVFHQAGPHSTSAGGGVSIASLLWEGDSRSRSSMHPSASQAREQTYAPGPTLAKKNYIKARESAAGCKEPTYTEETSKDECLSDDSAKTAATRVAAPAPERGGRKPGGRRCQWTADEHERFLSGLARFGPKDAGSKEPGARTSVGLGPGVAEVIAVVVGTRTVSQVRSHAQKYFLRKTRNNSAPAAHE